jgi:hypothetical protein
LGFCDVVDERTGVQHEEEKAASESPPVRFSRWLRLRETGRLNWLFQSCGHSPLEGLQRALRGVLGENTTGYALRASPEAKEQWFQSWQEREAEIAKLRAAGVRTIELAEQPARSCCVAPWYKPRPPRLKRKRS